MATLGTEQTKPSTAAQVLSVIAIAELPHGLWEDAMPQLQAIFHQAPTNEPLRVAVLETMGYICEAVVRLLDFICNGRIPSCCMPMQTAF